MLSHEQRLVITNVFHRLGWALAVAAAWAFFVVACTVVVILGKDNIGATVNTVAATSANLQLNFIYFTSFIP